MRGQALRHRRSAACRCTRRNSVSCGEDVAGGSPRGCFAAGSSVPVLGVARLPVLISFADCWVRSHARFLGPLPARSSGPLPARSSGPLPCTVLGSVPLAVLGSAPSIADYDVMQAVLGSAPSSADYDVMQAVLGSAPSIADECHAGGSRVRSLKCRRMSCRRFSGPLPQVQTMMSCRRFSGPLPQFLHTRSRGASARSPIGGRWA